MLVLVPFLGSIFLARLIQHRANRGREFELHGVAGFLRFDSFDAHCAPPFPARDCKTLPLHNLVGGAGFRKYSFQLLHDFLVAELSVWDFFGWVRAHLSLSTAGGPASMSGGESTPPAAPMQHSGGAWGEIQP